MRALLNGTNRPIAGSLKKVKSSLRKVERLLIEWQADPREWNQLLFQVFGRPAPIDLSGIAIEILDGRTMAGLARRLCPSYTRRYRTDLHQQ